MRGILQDLFDNQPACWTGNISLLTNTLLSNSLFYVIVYVNMKSGVQSFKIGVENGETGEKAAREGIT
jgi:hypothetical protein